MLTIKPAIDKAGVPIKYRTGAKRREDTFWGGKSECKVEITASRYQDAYSDLVRLVA
jgi:hypothetical protein